MLISLPHRSRRALASPGSTGEHISNRRRSVYWPIHFLVCIVLSFLWAIVTYFHTMETSTNNQNLADKVADSSMADTMKLKQAFQSCQSSGGKNLNLVGLRLKSLPQAVFAYSDTLELLNLGDNDLDSLPDDFYRLTKLRILFFANNKFRSIPIVLGRLPSLYMLSFKSNLVRDIPSESISPSLEWLILTDNQIHTLPPTIGALTKLKKCMLAGNQLTSLPVEMSQCKKLELLRISSNNFTSFPDWLMDSPSLTWIAASGNPVFPAENHVIGSNGRGITHIPSSDITLLQLIGEGASGYVYLAVWRNSQKVAVKIFKGAITSDGLPSDELSATLQFARHAESKYPDNGTMSDFPITSILGVISGNSLQLNASLVPSDSLSHQSVVKIPAGGIVMSLIPKEYTLLGKPPSFETITRDTFDPNIPKFSPIEACCIARDVALAMKEVHAAKLSHGDLYAHNLLVRRSRMSDDDTSTAISVRLCDFGGATSLGSGVSPDIAAALRAMELRAFGKLVDDFLVSLISEDNAGFNDKYLTVLKEIRKSTIGGGNDMPSLISLSKMSFDEVHRMISETCSNP